MVALFGRTSDLAALTAARAAVLGGSGRLVLITGEAGIGKSALAQRALEDAAADGCRVARGFAVDDPGAPALWPWRRVGRDLPEVAHALTTTAGGHATPDAVPAALPDAGARFRLSEAIADAVTAAAGPTGLAVLLEDLQWADATTVAVLKHLAQELAAARLLVLVTARDTEDTPFAGAWAELTRSPAAVSIPLRGLPEPAVRDWLAATGDPHGWLEAAPELAERTAGNPFYLAAITAQQRPPGSAQPTVDRLVLDRAGLRTILLTPLRSLPEGHRRTVATAAVLAERLSPMLLAAALGVPTESVSAQLADAVRVGLLHFGATGLAFRHAIVRDAVLAEMSADERIVAHEGIATAMDQIADDALVGPSAGHWNQVPGRPGAQRCRDRAARAAALAASDTALDRAVGFARMSLRHSRELDDPIADLAQRTLDLARYQWAAGLLPDALASCTDAMDLADRCDCPELMAQAALVPQGVGSLDVSRVRDGLCRRALDRLPAGDSPWRARLLGLLAVAAADEAVDSSAEVLSARALAMARRTGDPHAELDTIAARHFVLSYPQAIAERTALARRTLELAPHGSMGRVWGLLWLSDIALQEGDMSRWDTLVQDIEALAHRTGSPVARWHVARMQALRLALVGDFAASLEQADRGRRLAEQVGDISMLGMYFALRAQVALLRGEPDDVLGSALALMDRAPAMPLITVSKAQIYLAQGRRDAAAAAIAPLHDLPDRMPKGPRWSGSLGSLGMVAVDLDDGDLAARCYRALAPTAHWCLGDGGGTPYSLGSVDWPLGEMARCAGRPQAAIDHFRRAIEIDTRLGARPFVAMAQLGWARCLTDDDPHSPAGGDLAGTALAEFERLAMPGPAAAARRLLEHRGPAAPGDRLTGREAEVAGLVGRGLTNKQIAAQLFLSVRTVESHVRNALAKLQLTSRTELALWVHRPDR